MNAKKALLLFLSWFVLSHCVGQQAYQRTNTITGIRAIVSAQYPNHYLSIDNGEFFGSRYGDQGKIEVTQEIGSHELLLIKEIEPGVYAFGSTDVKERYLRMDGALVTPQSQAPGGILNLQVYVGGYEKFKIEKQADGTYTIESIAFPGRYLHMTKDKVLVSNRVGAKERFYLLEKERKLSH
ncbi:MAG: hypothetical protein AAF705_21175 [Bacteroidota bacterium]